MFDNVVIDSDILAGIKVRRQRRTMITDADGQAETRLHKWYFPRRVYEPQYGSMPLSQYLALRDFHDLRQGPARSFLMWDPIECYAASQNIGTGNGATATFQLTRTKSDGGNSITWNVLHPVPTGTTIPSGLRNMGPSGTPSTTAMAITVGGTPMVEGSDYTFSATTGIVTFTTIPGAAAAIVASFWFYTTVRFDEQDFEIELETIYAKSGPTLIECPLE